MIKAKHILPRLLSLALLLSLMGSSCKKEEISPLDQLPPATQEGKDTFGCLVNGKVHVPTGQLGFGVPAYGCYYNYTPPKNGRAGGYFFQVSAADMKSQAQPMITLGTYALELREGEVYPLTELYIEGRAYGDYYMHTAVDQKEYKIVSPLTGEMRITKLDEQRGIVAGTFWFDAVNAAGEKVEVREGRFDMKF